MRRIYRAYLLSDEQIRNSFTIEISVAFPDCKDRNYHLYGDMAEETLRVDAINKRYRLPGTFYGWFYYSDVYRKSTLLFRNIYHNVGREEAESFVPPSGWKLVQKFNGETARDICINANRQFQKTFKWVEKLEKKQLSSNAARISVSIY